jgi:hypothetical protein
MLLSRAERARWSARLTTSWSTLTLLAPVPWDVDPDKPGDVEVKARGVGAQEMHEVVGVEGVVTVRATPGVELLGAEGILEVVGMTSPGVELWWLWCSEQYCFHASCTKLRLPPFHAEPD